MFKRKPQLFFVWSFCVLYEYFCDCFAIQCLNKCPLDIPNLSKQTIFFQEQSLHMSISVFMYICTFSKDHRKLWNLQDLLSICLERGDTPVRFAYRTASEGFMVAEKWAKLFCTSNFRNKVHWSQSPCLFSILEM